MLRDGFISDLTISCVARNFVRNFRSSNLFIFVIFSAVYVNGLTVKMTEVVKTSVNIQSLCQDFTNLNNQLQQKSGVFKSI